MISVAQWTTNSSWVYLSFFSPSYFATRTPSDPCIVKGHLVRDLLIESFYVQIWWILRPRYGGSNWNFKNLKGHLFRDWIAKVIREDDQACLAEFPKGVEFLTSNMGMIGSAKLKLKLPLLFGQTILCADLALQKKQIMHNMLERYFMRVLYSGWNWHDMIYGLK